MMGAPEVVAEKPPRLSRSAVMCRQVAFLMKVHHAARQHIAEAVAYKAPHEAPLALMQWAEEGIDQILDTVKLDKGATV